MAVATITPSELSRELEEGRSILLIDVRERNEWDFARIEGARLMPLATLPKAAEGMDRDASIVVYCHHGMRSDAAARALMAAGFQNVRNLSGGIDRWSAEVDPAVPRYR